MYLIFDTETAGKIQNWKLPMTFVENFPRVTQLSFALYRENFDIVRKFNFIIKPDGWEVPKEKFFIDNNMSTERCEQYGVPIRQALGQFITEIENSNFLVAHNIDFDYPVLGAEMIRAGVKASRKLERLCTMKSSTNYCKLPGQRGQFKYPKLEELHMKLFGTMPEDTAHDALGDVMTTAKCFIELKRLKLI